MALSEVVFIYHVDNGHSSLCLLNAQPLSPWSPVPLCQQMMGGRLERATDEVAELVASRPAWMSGDPATFNEEQLREYKEYCAKEQAAIEERLKRKAVMVRTHRPQP